MLKRENLNFENKIEKRKSFKLANHLKHVIIGTKIHFTEGGKLVESSKDWKVITYGEVENHTIDAVKQSVDLTFKKLNYHGKNPEIHISEGEIILPNGGGKAPALLQTTKKGIKKIRLSRRGAKDTSAFKNGVDEDILLAALAAHEATHVDQGSREGVSLQEISTDNRETRLTKISGHPLELEANLISQRVIKEIYGGDLEWSE